MNVKVLNVFKIEVYDKEEAEELDKLDIFNSNYKVEIRIVDLYIDLIDVETFRKTYTTDQKERECVNIQTKSGESYVLLITLNDFLDKYESYVGTLIFK